MSALQKKSHVPLIKTPLLIGLNEGMAERSKVLTVAGEDSSLLGYYDLTE